MALMMWANQKFPHAALGCCGLPVFVLFTESKRVSEENKLATCKGMAL